ncbi:hypothetical protein CP353_06680 [Lactobacillus sp. UMNPBX2]|nr:hypothetical protein CP353_06680 [Lactobacillus sp. UMNPBX2]
MYKQSNEAKLAYQSAERTLDIVVNVNGVDYKATDIEQFDYDSGGYTGDTFSIGSTYENNITVKFIHLVEGLKRGMIVKPKIGIKLPSGTFEYTPLGVFIIADEIQMDRNNNSTTIKAYDKFVVMEGQYVSKLTYPANAVDIITEIAQMCKVDVNTNDLAHLPTIKVSKAITKQSYRTAIGWIAQLYVGFASFDRDGKLTIRRVAEPNYTIEPSEYEQQGLVKNEAPYIIGGISCNVNVVETTNNGETNETTHKLHSGSVNGSQIELTNDIMTQELLDSIWDSLKTITFYPFSLNWFGNPAIEAGDWLSLKDMKGNVFVVPNNGYTISFNGGLSSTSKADQNATDSSTVKYTGELTRAIENYSRRQAPDGTNIYTDVKEPTDAKFNDVWFKPNGNSTELWIFERQSDGTGKWVKQPVNGEVEQKINDALKDFDELDKSFKDNANTQSATNELMKSRIDSISNQIPNLSDEISRVNGSVTSLKTQTDKDRQQLQTTSQNLDQARQDVLSNSSRIDKLSVSLDSVNINVNNVNSKVDNIKVGGTNLVRNSGNPNNTDSWAIGGMSNDRKLIVWSHSFWKNRQENLFSLFNRDSNEVYMCSNRIKVERNTEYTLSYWAFADSKVISSDTFFLCRKNGETSDFTVIKQLIKERRYSGGHAEYVSVTFNTDESDEGYIRFDNNGSKEVGKDAVLFLANIKLEKGNIATDWSPAPEDEIERVAQLRVDLNGMNATVATNKGDIAQIKLTENGMQQSIKDAQGNISTLQNDSKQFKQQFKDVNGNITTIKNGAKSLSSQLSTKVGTSEYNSFKEQTAQELRTKLIASDLSGYAKSADVKVSVDGLNARFDNLNVGGTNLVRNSGNPQNTKGWNANGSTDILMVTKHSYWKNGQENLFLLLNRNTNGNGAIFSSDIIKVDRNTDYTLSYWAFEDSYVPNSNTWFLGRKNGETSNFNVIKRLVRERKYSGGHAEYVSVTFNTGDCDEGYIRFDNNGNSGNNQSGLYIANIKLEKGNIATDWSPAPEDIDNKIEVLSGKITANSNEFSTVYSKITNAKNDAVNAIKGDSQWQSMGKIVTNAAFLQNSDGFAQEVVKTTTPMVNGGGKNLARGTSDSWTGVGTQEFNGGTNFAKHVAYVYLDELSVGDRVSVQIIYQYSGVTSTNAKCWLQGYGDVTVWGRGQFYGTPTTINMETGTDLKSGSKKYTFTIDSEMKKNRFWRVAWRFDNVNKGARFQWLKFKVEKGTVATPYSPAPEDLATKLQLNQVIDTADSHTRTISDYLTGSNSRFVQMANYLNMNVKNSSVSINGNGVMLSGNRIKITGKTLIDNAVILDALIKDINANTVKTKTLDASKINVTNLNANNITTGTISGANLNINLDSGDVSFQKGVLYNNKNLKIDLTNGFLEIQDTKKTRGLLITDGNIFISKDLSSIDPSKQIANIGYNDGSGMDLDVFNVGKMSFTYSEIVDKSNNVSLETRPVNWRNKDYLGPQLYMKAGEYKNTHTFAIRTNGDGLGASILGDNDKITISASDVSISKIKYTYIENLDATNLHVYGSKNSVVPSSKGYIAINAYETAEYYFGDIGESQTDKQGVKIINLDPLFLETVNTSVPYQVFLSSYDDAKVWVFARNDNMFIVKSDKPNVKFAWEIKAKRKDYENVRLKTVDLKNERN